MTSIWDIKGGHLQEAGGLDFVGECVEVQFVVLKELVFLGLLCIFSVP